MNRKWWLFIDAILLGVILAHALPAFGQALPTVEPATNWTAIGIAVACVFLIAGGIWWLRDRPGAVAKAKEESGGLKDNLAAVALSLSENLHKLTQTHAEAVATIPAALAATPSPGAQQAFGKFGNAGTLVIAVTGDPDIDLPAINAQYFGS